MRVKRCELTVQINNARFELVQREAEVFCDGLLKVDPPLMTCSDRPEAGTLRDHVLSILSDDFAKARGILVRPFRAEFFF